jgi:uncharacterized protein YjbJ (UPF0337 family)
MQTLWDGLSAAQMGISPGGYHNHRDGEFSMNNDQIKGRIDEAKGKVKETAAKVTGNKTLEERARVEEAAGKLRADYGDAKSEAKKAVKDVLKNRA